MKTVPDIKLSYSAFMHLYILTWGNEQHPDVYCSPDPAKILTKIKALLPTHSEPVHR